MNNPTALPPTILGLQRILAAGFISPSEALTAQSRHMSCLDATYRCVVHALPAPAPSRHDAVLNGVGLAHKDIFDTAERHAGCGRPVVPAGKPAVSAVALERLKNAGAANLAALSMAEFACGATGENPHLPLPVNPLDSQAAVGGSSSGSAVAVAAGMAYASLGTDTAGSVRIPAATCGLVGIKPTYNLISCAGVSPLAPSLDTVGILARSAADAALLLAVTANRQDEALCKAAASPDRLETYLLAQRHWRVRSGMQADGLAPDVALTLASFADALERLHDVSLVHADGVFTDFKDMSRCAEVLLHVEAAQRHWQRLQTGMDDLAAATRAVALPGVAIPSLWYREALARRASYAGRFIRECFHDADILLVPALPNGIPDWAQVLSTSPQFMARELLALHRWMAFVNYLGFPSIVFPVGSDARGRPVSVQAIASPYAESALLSFAYRFEREHHGREGFCRPVEPVRQPSTN